MTDLRYSGKDIRDLKIHRACREQFSVWMKYQTIHKSEDTK